MDKPTQPERVMEGLTKYGIITEDWGAMSPASPSLL